MYSTHGWFETRPKSGPSLRTGPVTKGARRWLLTEVCVSFGLLGTGGFGIDPPRAISNWP